MSELALEGIETPAYLYDLDEVRRAYAQLVAALPTSATVFYSLKANPHPEILRVVRRLGALAEVCSPGELDAALDAGFQPAAIQYTGPAKRDRDVDAALASGVLTFSVDSPHGLEQLDRLAADRCTPVTALLRINDDAPARGQGLAMTGVASQFGADASWVVAEPGRFRGGAWARLGGLHLYMGTNLHDEDALAAQFEQAIATARTLRSALGTPSTSSTWAAASARRSHGPACCPSSPGSRRGSPACSTTRLRPGVTARHRRSRSKAGAT